MPEKSLGEQNYEQFARRYAEAASTKPDNAYYDRPAVLSLLPDVNGKRVLDAGCGPGIYAEILLDQGAEVIAFDVTPDFVEITQERVGDRAKILHADLSQPLKFAQSGEFDVVICSLVLDYIEDWGAVFSEFHRVLKAGGVLVFSAAHPVFEWLLIKDRQLVPEDSTYFQTFSYAMTWNGFGEPRPQVTSYHRPLSEMLNPLLEAGFRLDHILEPRPTQKYEEIDPDGYAKLMQRPGFIVIRARN